MTYLEAIIEEKRKCLRERKDLTFPSLERRDFLSAFKGEGTRIIAEIKKASPSKGIICSDFDPVGIARVYEENGACAISVITEERFFLGSLSYIEAVKKAVSLPVLRKDFILEEFQIRESLNAGADAVLLIARVHERERLIDLVEACLEAGLVPLLEVHDRSDLEKALSTRARLIGINNRDLNTFRVSIETSLRLKPMIPEDRIAISESGISTRKEIEALERAGFRGFLIGESLLRERDRGRKLRELLGKGDEGPW